jgi:hypothetical protein
MSRHQIDEELRAEINSQLTLGMRTAARELDCLLRGAHRPTEGENLEHLVRESLRKRLPTRFTVSTGFVSFLSGPSSASDRAERTVSPQYDVIVWDDHACSPLFRTGELVIVSPKAVVAIIEVTKTLDGRKLKTDLTKLDWVLDAHSNNHRPGFNPFTAVLAFASNGELITNAQRLEHYYNHQARILPPLRYSWSRAFEEQNWIGAPIPLFVDMVAILDAGSICAERQMFTDPARRVNNLVRYNLAPHSETLTDAMDRLEGRIQLECHRRVAGSVGDRDPFQEFKHVFNPESQCGILLDASHPNSGGTAQRERHDGQKLAGPTGTYQNVGKYSTRDWTRDAPTTDQPLPADGRVIEFYSGRSWGSGNYKDGSRVGEWRVQMVGPKDTGWAIVCLRSASDSSDLRDLVRRQEGLWTDASLMWLPDWVQ